jgi:Putative metallopeptidase
MITRQLASILIAASVLTAAPVVQARDSIDVRIADASERLATLSASAAALHPHERERMVQFVVGNTLFALGHELGHALVSDLRLPVLGREEDAVDIFATLALLQRRMLFGIRSSAASPSATSWSITTPTWPVLLFPSDSLVSTMDARKGRTLFRQRLPSAEGEAG